MKRILRLTLLAPDIVKTIPGGKQSPKGTLARVPESFPMEWWKQKQRLMCGEHVGKAK